MFCLIVSGRGVGRLVRGGVLSYVLLRRVRCCPPRVNLRGPCADCANIGGGSAPEHLLCRGRAPFVLLPWAHQAPREDEGMYAVGSQQTI